MWYYIFCVLECDGSKVAVAHQNLTQIVYAVTYGPINYYPMIKKMEDYSSDALETILFHSEVLYHIRVDEDNSDMGQSPETFFNRHPSQPTRQ
jgi:hypothetical protein